MNTYSKTAIPMIVAASLAACGGSSSDPVTPVPLDLAAASFSEGPTPIVYDPAAGTLSVNGVDVVTPIGATSLVNGDVTIYRSGAPLHTSAIAQSGDVFAVVSTTNVGTDVTAFEYGRRGATTLAQTGSASYTGDYAGYFVNDVTGTVTSQIDGDLALTADLGANTISGEITNRQSFSNAGVANVTAGANDAIISGGTIAADGTFNANVTEGEFFFNAGANEYTTETGSIDGAFGGTDGNAVVGVFSLPQEYLGTEYTEVGSVIGERD